MLTGKVATEKITKIQCTVSVVSGEGYHILNEAKIIQQKIYAI